MVNDNENLHETNLMDGEYIHAFSEGTMTLNIPGLALVGECLRQGSTQKLRSRHLR